MYESFFGLRERPFELTPNPRFLFLTNTHREALGNLRYGLSAARGITLLVGEAGTGKTTLLRAALALEQRNQVRYVLLDNPTMMRSEFYEYLAAGFRLSDEAAQSKARFLIELRRDVQERHANGGVTSLVIDEAQSLPYELLEEVRLLANMETSTAKLLNVVLSGQPELADRLNEGTLRQLKQRVLLRCELGSLDARETAAYVAGRLRIAGAELVHEIFTREAVMAVHRLSRGIPRTISVICENALLGAFAQGRKPVDEAMVLEVSRDFDLHEQRAAATNLIGPGEVEAARTAVERQAPEPEAPTVPRAVAVGDDRPMFAGLAPVRKRRFLFF
jgi:type II secretory pathway predicted ATPase ExeA